MGFYPLKCKCSSILINLAYIGDMLVKNALATSNLLNITSQCNLKHSLKNSTLLVWLLLACQIFCSPKMHLWATYSKRQRHHYEIVGAIFSTSHHYCVGMLLKFFKDVVFISGQLYKKVLTGTYF